MAHEVRVPLTEKTDWSQRMLLLADLHIDNPHSDLPLIKRTLEEARKTNARIYLFGDTFCAMQGKYDPRGSKADVRPEHQVNNYLDAIVEWTADILGPYADLIDIIGYGNHETSVLKRQESDLVQRLVAVLNDRNKSNIETGTYAGYVVWRFMSGPKTNTHILHYDHGSGGGGPVTRGVIGTNRRAVYVADAHTVATGHIHERWLLEISRERIDKRGRVKLDIQTHVQLGTAKEERGPGIGFHVERGRGPKPLGWWWLEHYWDGQAKEVRTRYLMTDR
jgi:hypothetical protein